MKNTQETLEEYLDTALDSAERQGFTTRSWFYLAAVAVRCLISIASALWDRAP